MRTLLSPRWIAGHLLAVTAVVAFVIFGFWQLDRHDQKLAIKNGVEEAAAMPLMDYLGLEGEDPTYRTVLAAGRYDTSAEILVLRSRLGTPGHSVVTPLVLDDGSALIVERGWVPLDYDEPPVADAAPPNAIVTVTGQVWPGAAGDIPNDRPGVMKRIDPFVFEAFTDYSVRDEGYLVLFDQTPSTEGELPLLPDRPEVSLGPHLGYAGQWFLFAAVVLIGYPTLLRRTVRS